MKPHVVIIMTDQQRADVSKRAVMIHNFLGPLLVGRSLVHAHVSPAVFRMDVVFRRGMTHSCKPVVARCQIS